MSKSTKAALLFLSFVVVVLVGLACVVKDCPGLLRRSYHTIVLGDRDFIDKKVRFRIQVQGTASLPNGLLGGFTTVRASDCVDAISEAENEGSALQAANEMEEKVRIAVRVIEQGPLVESQGELLGERAVLIVKSAKGEPSIEIVTLYKR